MLEVRSLIFEAANGIPLEPEMLKWGEPSYRPLKGGTTVRLGWKKSMGRSFGVYFHCQTSLIATYTKLYGNLFSYEGKRALIFHVNRPLPQKELKHCIFLAFTYHS